MIINVQEIFKHELKRLGLNKKDVAEKLEMTMPTLNSRIEKPETLTVKDLNKLKELEFNLKTIYLIGIFLQFPCYIGIAYISGYSLVVLCILAAVFNASILPTENLLLGKFTPQKYHGVVYGIKFILAFGSGPISVFLISEIYSITLEFTYLFLINAIMMALVSIFIIFLPIQNNKKIATQD